MFWTSALAEYIPSTRWYPELVVSWNLLFAEWFLHLLVLSVTRLSLIWTFCHSISSRCCLLLLHPRYIQVEREHLCPPSSLQLFLMTSSLPRAKENNQRNKQKKEVKVKKPLFRTQCWCQSLELSCQICWHELRAYQGLPQY